MSWKETLFGSTKNNSASTLTGAQKDILGGRAALANGPTGYDAQAGAGFAGLAGTGQDFLNSGVRSAYEGIPDFEGAYNQMYGNPLRQQFQGAISTLQHGGERHSSGRKMREMGALQNFNMQSGQARQNMMMDERQKQMQALESAYGRQNAMKQAGANLQSTAYNGMLNFGNSALNTTAKQNYQTQDPGAFSMLNSAVGSADNLMSFAGY